MNNTTGNYNIAIGFEALYSNETASYNIATGNQALYSNNYGTSKPAIGYAALYSNTIGSHNTSVGESALYSNVTGDNNTAVGYYAGPGLSDDDLSNTGAFGYDAQPTASNRVHIGNTVVNWIGGQVSWSTYSDQRFKRNINEDVAGLDFILKIRPVTYQWNIQQLNNFIGKDITLYSSGSMANSQREQESNIYSGFLAQEVEVAAEELGFEFSGVQAPVNENTPYSLSYSEFVVPLVKAVQEQQEMIDNQNIIINQLLTRIEKLEASN